MGFLTDERGKGLFVLMAVPTVRRADFPKGNWASHGQEDEAGQRMPDVSGGDSSASWIVRASGARARAENAGHSPTQSGAKGRGRGRYRALFSILCLAPTAQTG